MKLNILYFGMVAEAIKCTQENLVLDTPTNTDQLKGLLIKKYKVLNSLSYQIAINKQLANKNTLITNDSEIAILPPFAGG